MKGSFLFENSRATALFAASMNSSIILCAMLRSERTISSIFPLKSIIICGSGRSKSREPSASLFMFNLRASPSIILRLSNILAYLPRRARSSSEREGERSLETVV